MRERGARTEDTEMRRLRRALIAATSVVAILGGGVSLAATPALAAEPIWRLDALANTTSAPGASANYLVQITNTGETPSAEPGDPTCDPATPPIDPDCIVLSVEIPAGLTVLAVNPAGFSDLPFGNCAGIGVPGPTTITCTQSSVVQPKRFLTPVVEFAVAPDAAGTLTSHFQVSGGGAGEAGTVAPIEVTPEPPSFGIAAFDQQVSADTAGAPSTQAAGHPYAVTTSIDFNTVHNPDPLVGDLWPVAPARDVLVDLPPGFIGNPTVASQCTMADLANSNGPDPRSLCLPGSQVGTTMVRVKNLAFSGGQQVRGPIPVFRVLPPPGVPARFGFNFAGVMITLDARLRSSGDYGLSVDARNIPELAIAGSSFTFWGVPADPSHTPERACPNAPQPWQDEGPTCASDAEPRAFLRNPSACTPAGAGLRTSAHIDSWVEPGAQNSDGSADLADPRWDSATSITHQAPGYPYPAQEQGKALGIEGCDEVPFDPSISVVPTTKQADSPSGLEVDLSVPQQELSEPDAIAQSDLKTAVVTLPQGMAVNPSQASGLGACTSAQIGLLGTEFEDGFPIHFTNEASHCPDSSKIGTLSIKTPLLDHPVDGALYLAKQADNPFKSLLAMYLVAEDPASGTIIKLAGRIEIGADGRLTTSFDYQPQLPFETVHLELFGGSRAALITPPTCGTKTTEATLSPWSGNAPLELPSSFEITSGPAGAPCSATETAMPFSPTLSAGSTNPIPGATSPFTLKLTRADGEQRFASLDTTPPPGLSAYLKGVPYCPEPALSAARVALLTGAGEQASPSCPAASRVGSVDSAAGAGVTPFHAPGAAYLAGPYKGAPLSFAIFVPAVAGPFDLGDVLVRAGIYVDPTSAQITVKSDPLPQTLQGIPLDLRSVFVSIDRDHFTVNPTSCNPMAVSATVRSTQGAIANPSDRYQLLGCDHLPFKPNLRFRFKGGTHRTDHPALSATLTAKPGEANIARAQVKLPKAAFLDNAHIGTICTRVQFAAHACPAASVYGHATAITPLLDAPLQGPVYLRSSSHQLPDLVADLNGQIEVALAGKTDSVKGALRNTFEAVPDAPVTKFSLTLFGGKRGLIELSSGFCSHPRASVKLDGQNGRVHDTNPIVASKCPKKPKKPRTHREEGGGR